ncbi:MAG TPA: hypothetical protein VEJ63_03485 [Planctomycetota bacterium]|nr:hypothetical protein [Planctomycetota bacterium]
MKRAHPAALKVQSIKAPESAETRRHVLLAAIVLTLATFLLARSASAEEQSKENKELMKRLAEQRAEAERRKDTSGMTAEQLANHKKQLQDHKEKQEKLQNLAEFKEKSMNNLAAVKEMFMKAEAAHKEKQYAIASPLYNSVALATVPGSEQIAETSRGRLIEYEKLAQDELKKAEDADLKQDFVKEVEILAAITKDFHQTKTKETALRNLIALKTRPDVAGYVEIAQAEELERNEKITEAVAIYNSVATNPRYENTVPALKASRRLEELQKDAKVADKLKAESDAKADKEAPLLLNAAKNYVANNRPKMALEKLQTIVDKYPDSKYAEQARKQIEELKAVVSAQ